MKVHNKDNKKKIKWKIKPNLLIKYNNKKKQHNPKWIMRMLNKGLIYINF